MPHHLIMDNHKEKFDEFCEATSIDGENKGSKTVSKVKGDIIVKFLSKETSRAEFSPMFKHWVKTGGFQLVIHSTLGLSNVVLAS